jgi:hypothetical protein
LLIPGEAWGHDIPRHLDPELLTGWRTWLHLTIQWTHLVSFAVWLGLTAGTLLLRIKTRLDLLLYNSWILFLLMLATGTYNMEWSAGISETPSLFLLPLLERIPYGVTYTVVLAVKVALYGLSVLLTLVVTVLHLRRGHDEARLRQVFITLGSLIGLAIALATAVVLFYHEVADLWPTRPHSLGGVMGPDGPRGQFVVSHDILAPNDFQLLLTPDAWIDIALRWLHLVGFGLWLGGTMVAAVSVDVDPKRFLWFSWTSLIIQLFSGLGNMGRWTPFYVAPFIWNFSALSEIRFGGSYALFMAAKHALVITVIGLTLALTYRYVTGRSKQEQGVFSLRPWLIAGAVLGLAIAYIMVIVLLLHEGVDHAL